MIAPAFFVGGPLDGAVRDVDVEQPTFTYTRRIVYKYDWAGGNTFTFAGSVIMAEDGSLI